jgi:hypothetical protein
MWASQVALVPVYRKHTSCPGEELPTCRLTEFGGEIHYDPSKPAVTPHKLMIAGEMPDV